MPGLKSLAAPEPEFTYLTKTTRALGQEWTFRELNVEENDECSEMAKAEGGMINGRVLMRAMLMASSVDPKITPGMLAKLPQRVYLHFCDVVNQLNSPDTVEDDEQGNDSNPSTS